MDRILLIDDDVELCELVGEFLSSEGFTIAAVHDGAQGVTQALNNQYELIVLDVMLPSLNGFEVLRRIRAASRTPIIMLTARGEDVDRIIGLELGADDYLPKPFNPRELVARIRAVLRRMQATNAPEPATRDMAAVSAPPLLRCDTSTTQAPTSAAMVCIGARAARTSDVLWLSAAPR